MANVKGLVLVELVRLLRANRDAAEAQLPKALHSYLDDWIVLANWYPEADFALLLGVAAKLVPASPEDALHGFGRVTADQHARELYSHLLAGDRESLVLTGRLFQLWNTQHDSGQMSLRVTGASRAEIDLLGYQGASFETCQVGRGYLERLLQLAGFERLTLVELCCRRNGDSLCRWEAVWS